jgi:hypothetical protein
MEEEYTEPVLVALASLSHGSLRVALNGAVLFACLPTSVDSDSGEGRRVARRHVRGRERPAAGRVVWTSFDQILKRCWNLTVSRTAVRRPPSPSRTRHGP